MVNRTGDAERKKIQALRPDLQTGSFEGMKLEPDGTLLACNKRADPAWSALLLPSKVLAVY